MLALAAVVGAVLLVKRRDFVLYAFDPGFAHAIGLRPRLLDDMLLVILALTGVVALQIVGVVLVVAMLVIPGSTARLLTDRFSVMLAISVGVSLMGTLIGLDKEMDIISMVLKKFDDIVALTTYVVKNKKL